MFYICYCILTILPLPVSFTICGAALVMTTLLINSFISNSSSVPNVYYKDSSFAKYVLKRVKRLNIPYRTPRGLTNTHLQSLLPKLIYAFAANKINFHRQYIQMKDQAVVSIDWVESFEAPSSVRNLMSKRNAFLIIIPSLHGGINEVVFLCQRAVYKGFRPVIFNKRGHNNSFLTTSKLQSFGDVSDLRQTIRYIHNTYPNRLLTAVGISFDGCGLLFSYLGEYGSSSLITGSVCISCAYDTESLLHKSITQPYHYIYLLVHKFFIWKHAKSLEKIINFPKCIKSKSVGELEHNVYAKLYGFQTMSSYWDKNNPMRDVDDISSPVLCINSLDDPVCSKDNIPQELFSYYPNFMLVTTENGGHCGFLEGSFNNLQSWAYKITTDYLTAVTEFMNKSENNNEKTKQDKKLIKFVKEA